MTSAPRPPGGEASPTLPNDPPPTDAAAEAPFVAVVHVHGMGSQWHYEELTRLVRNLERYGQHPENTLGRLGDIRVGSEPSAVMDAPVMYVQARYERGDVSRLVRFYEVYWAPLTRRGVAPWEVLRWLLRHVTTPLSHIAAPWRQLRHIRSAWLYARPGPERRELLAYYKAFCTDMGTPERSTFRDFLRSLPEDGALARLARRWRRQTMTGELAGLCVLTGVVSGLVLVCYLSGLLTAALVYAPTVPGGFLAAVGTLFTHPELFWQASLGSVFAGAVGLFVTGIAGSFLRDSLGDVVLFTTYHETDEEAQKRQAVLGCCQDTLRHVLDRPGCTRLVVSAHSLGTRVAYDAIRALQLGAEARGEREALRRLDALLTYGSPIDKIHYFFEARQSKNPRYTQLMDGVQFGNDRPPFCNLRWVNVHDRGDPISEALTTPNDPARPGADVLNERTVSSLFAQPGDCHGAYPSSRHLLGQLLAFIDGPATPNPFAPDRPAFQRTVRRVSGVLAAQQAALLLAMGLPVLAACGQLLRWALSPQTVLQSWPEVLGRLLDLGRAALGGLWAVTGDPHTLATLGVTAALLALAYGVGGAVGHQQDNQPGVLSRLGRLLLQLGVLLAVPTALILLLSVFAVPTLAAGANWLAAALAFALLLCWTVSRRVGPLFGVSASAVQHGHGAQAVANPRVL